MSTHYLPGRYRVRITTACLGESSKGTPQLEIGIEILGYHDPAEGTYHESANGPERMVYIALTEGTLGTPQSPGWAYQQLLDLGWQGQSFAALEPLVGQVRDAECKHEAWDDKVSEKWSIYRRRGNTPLRPIQDRNLRDLNKRFSGLLKAGARATPPTGSPEDSEGDDAVTAPLAPPQAPPKARRRSKAEMAAELMTAPPQGGNHEDIPF
jgi:hypothetical protein